MPDVSAIRGSYGGYGRRGARYRGGMPDVSAIRGSYGRRGLLHTVFEMQASVSRAFARRRPQGPRES